MITKLCSNEKFILRTAIKTRLVLTLIAIVSNWIAGDFDSSAEIILPPTKDAPITTELLKMIIKPLVRWDAMYFLDIAKNGYQFEQQLAFFPLYPALMHVLSYGNLIR